MRVVAGMLGGRRLVAPPGRDVRPTSDKVRGAVFNALDALDAVRGSTVADLFAGSGALGIEALSRGAARCTFVESSPPALRALHSNVEALGLRDEAEVVAADALRWLASAPGRFDLALADPPYAFDRWSELFGLLQAVRVVAEADRPVDPPPGWLRLRYRRYGGTVVTFLRQDG